MHAIIAVIHEDPIFNENDFSKFCWDNEDYHEAEYLTESLEESLKKVDEYEQLLREEIQNSAWGETSKKTLDELLSLESNMDRVRFYASQEYVEVDDEGRLYENHNPIGFCDWFTVGGRWDNSLYDFNGQGHNTLLVTDFNPVNPNSLKAPYGVVREYLGEEYLDEGEEFGDGKEWDEILSAAKEYMERKEIPLYITLVDIHQ